MLGLRIHRVSNKPMEYMVVNSYMTGAYVACINHTHTGASHAAAAAILPARGQPSRHVRSILGGERSCPPPYGASGIGLQGVSIFNT